MGWKAKLGWSLLVLGMVTATTGALLWSLTQVTRPARLDLFPAAVAGTLVDRAPAALLSPRDPAEMPPDPADLRIVALTDHIALLGTRISALEAAVRAQREPPKRAAKRVLYRPLK